MELSHEPLKRLSVLFLTAAKKYLGDILLAIYLYGSALSDDYAVRSDIDFAVLLHTLPTDAEDRIRALHSELSEAYLPALALEGGYHTVKDGSAVGRRMGVWVNEQVEVEHCELELEPDSAVHIIDGGLILCGFPLEHYYPRPCRQELLRFSERYLLDYEDKLPERMNSAKHFFSSILNACRSICYYTDGVFPTKTCAARRVEEIFPNSKTLLERAIAYRNGIGPSDYTVEDIRACRELIAYALENIVQKGSL